MPKPYRLVHFDEDDDFANVYRNPIAGLLKKIIGDHDCRAFIDIASGDLYAWPENNCYHDDVRKALNLGRIVRLMLISPDCPREGARVAVKGFNSEPEAFTDSAVLSVLHSNRGLRNLYGEQFPVETYDWN